MPDLHSESPAAGVVTASTSATEVKPFIGGPSEQWYYQGPPLRCAVIFTAESLDDGDVMVTDDLISEAYGVGETVRDAIEDYLSMLQEYHRELRADRDRLSSYLRQRLELLDRCLDPAA